MKRLSYIFLIGSLLSFVGCNDFLELTPTYKFDADKAYESIEAAETALNGAFDGLQGGALFGGGLIANTELLADMVSTDPISDFSLSQLSLRQMNAFNGEANGLWQNGYNAVNRANGVLAALPNLTTDDDYAANAERMEGECKFIRAICHFEMVRMFALPYEAGQSNSQAGVPIATLPGSTVQNNDIPRSSVEEVYQAVITDLTEAYEVLPVNNDRASKYAAAAYLARIYFQMQDYSNAASWAKIVIDNGGYSLSSDLEEFYRTVGSPIGSEGVFSLINLTNDNSTAALGRFRQLGSNEALYHFSSTAVTLFDTEAANNGIRANLVSGLNNRFFTTKYQPFQQNVPVLRYAEVLLTAAEAAYNNGDEGAARNYVNEILTRAELSTTSATGTDLLAVIQEQRAVELAFEGDRLHNLRRLKLDIAGFAYNADELIFPVPQREMDVNSSLVQNPGY